MMTIYAIQGLFDSCPVEEWFAVYILLNIIANIILFVNFYVKNYLKKSTKTH